MIADIERIDSGSGLVYFSRDEDRRREHKKRNAENANVREQQRQIMLMSTGNKKNEGLSLSFYIKCLLMQ